MIDLTMLEQRMDESRIDTACKTIDQLLNKQLPSQKGGPGSGRHPEGNNNEKTRGTKQIGRASCRERV